MDTEPTDSPAPITRASSLLLSFTSFREELDEHHARRERIIKLSRDITGLSKKLIFCLHRITNRDRKDVFKEAAERIVELVGMFAKLREEVEGENFWRYEKSVSPGIQEFLEGITFHHYLLHQTLPSLSYVQALLSTSPSPSPSSPSTETAAPPPPSIPLVLVTPEDYLGGIADLTGELMRLAIGSVGRSLVIGANGDAQNGEKEREKGMPREEDGLASIKSIAVFVREIKGQIDPLSAPVKWLSKKLEVLDQSLSKIESALYALRIRSAEYEGGSPEMLRMLAERLASNGAGALVSGAVDNENQKGSPTYQSQEGGAPFNRNITPGGHPLDNSQPAFPIYHRRFANPAPLGLAAFALTTFVLSLINAGTLGVTAPQAVIGLALFYGGLVQLLAGMWEFAAGNTFGATAFSSYGGFWMSFAFLIAPWSGVASSYKEVASFEYAIGFYLMGWFIFTFLMLIASLRSSIALTGVFFFLTITFLLLGISKFIPSQATAIGKAGGIFGLITAFNAWYVALAGLLSPDTSFFVLPVGDMTKKD